MTCRPRRLLALAVMAVWGTNFVVIRLGLDDLPPLLFAALRFTLALLPAVFFLPRPAVRGSKLAAYGVLIGAWRGAALPTPRAPTPSPEQREDRRRSPWPA